MFEFAGHFTFWFWSGWPERGWRSE